MGEANPTELPIVMKERSKYLVLEGNRRFAALKLLSDPKLADKSDHQSAFERIRAKGKSPATIYCAVVNSREQADHWIMLRHTGANNGVSTKRWSAEQTATHRRRMSASVDTGTLRSIAIADELTEAYQTDDGLVALIQRVRSAKLTNIGRFFANDVLTRLQFEVRHVPGPGVRERTLWARHDAQQLHPFFWWAFDFIDKHTVDAFKNPDVRRELLNGTSDLIPSPTDGLAADRRLADYPYTRQADPSDGNGQAESKCTDSDSDEAGDGGGTAGSSENPDGGGQGTDSGEGTAGGSQGGRKRDLPLEKQLYSAVRLPNLPMPVQRILREARVTVMEESPYTACVLSRVVLELTVSSPAVLKWSGSSENKTLDQKIRACLFKLDPDIDKWKVRTRLDLVQAYQELDGIGVQYMNQFVHNSLTHADHHLARRFSTAFSPLLNAIDDAIAGQS